MPGHDVFGVDPARARHRSCSIGNVYYTYLARRLAATRGPHRRDGDAVRAERPAHVHRRLRDHAADLPARPRTRCAAWEAGLAWAFIIGVIVLIGAFVGPYIRKYTPRAAMLGTLAGHLDHVHLDAPGRADVGGAVDRAAGAGDHPDRLLHRREAAGQHPDRPGRAAASARRSAGSAAYMSVPDVTRRRAGHRHRAPDAELRPAGQRAAPTSRRCSPPRSRWASTTSPRA